MSEQDYETIYRFFNNELDTAERAAFEERLQAEPELAAEAQFHRALMQGIALTGDEELKAAIAKAAARHEPQTAAAPRKLWVRFPGRRSLAIAASMLLLLLAGYFLLQDFGSKATLFADFYHPDRVALEEKMDELELVGMAIPEQERRASLKQALELVQQQAYPAAGQSLTEHLDRYPQDDAALYFLGLSYLEQRQFERAVSAFAQLQALPASPYSERADWYSGLAYLQMAGKEAQAKAQFEAIAATFTHPFVQQATALLEAW